MSSFNFQHWDHLKPRLQMKFCPQCEMNSSIVLDSGDKFNQDWHAINSFLRAAVAYQRLSYNLKHIIYWSVMWWHVGERVWWGMTMWLLLLRTGGLKKIFYLFRAYFIPWTEMRTCPGCLVGYATYNDLYTPR